MTDSALQRARERALAKVAPPKAAPVSSPAKTTLSGEQVKHSSGLMVPIELYDWPPAKQKQFIELKRADAAEAAAESRFDRTAMSLLDLQEAQAKRITKLESQLETAVVVIDRLQQQLDQKGNEVELAKSNALAEQEVAIAQQVVNLTTVRAEAEAAVERMKREGEELSIQQARWTEDNTRLTENHTAMVKSNTKVLLDVVNGTREQWAEVSSEAQRTKVVVEENTNAIDAIGRPITRAEVSELVAGAVLVETKRQLPPLVDQQLLEDRKNNIYSPGGMVRDRKAVEQGNEDAARFNAERYGDDLERARLAKGRRG